MNFGRSSYNLTGIGQDSSDFLVFFNSFVMNYNEDNVKTVYISREVKSVYNGRQKSLNSDWSTMKQYYKLLSGSVCVSAHVF